MNREGTNIRKWLKTCWERARLLWIRLRLRVERWSAEKGLYYIGGSDALPAPLSPEEEKQLIVQLILPEEQVVDEERMKQCQEAKTILIERNLRLVVYIAKKFENAGVNVEDLISIGTIGLIKAVNTFNPNKNIKLATYASRCIENEILMYLRRNSRTRTEVSFDEPLNVDWDGNELLLSDVLGTEGDLVLKNIEKEVERKLLYLAMDKLSSRERRIMELRFGLTNGVEKTQKEVAELLGISQSYISRLEKRIIKRLQREIRKME